MGVRECEAPFDCPPSPQTKNTPPTPLPVPVPPWAHPRCSLMQLRASETPVEQLPTVPPSRLLPALLSFLRASAPTHFCYVTNLTRMAMQKHLQPFMELVHNPLTGDALGVRAPLSLPIAYKLTLRGSQQPVVPWPADVGRPWWESVVLPGDSFETFGDSTLWWQVSSPGSSSNTSGSAGSSGGAGSSSSTSGNAGSAGSAALLVIKAVLAAREYLGNNSDCAYLVAERVLQALDEAGASEAVKAELAAAAGVPDPEAALDDLRYICHDVCVTLLVQHVLPLQQAGQGQDWQAAFDRHSAALLRLRPDLAAPFATVALGHNRGGDFMQAQVVALKGLAVADAARDSWFGASLRQVLAGSMCMAGEARTPGRLRVGELRRLIGEAALLQKRYQSWVPEGETQRSKSSGAVALGFFDSGGFDAERRMQLPNEAVEPCLGGWHRSTFMMCAGEDMKPTCGGCSKEIKDGAKRCARCWAVCYHDADCQRRHWKGGHRRQCQLVEVPFQGLEWGAELAKAEAGLAAAGLAAAVPAHAAAGGEGQGGSSTGSRASGGSGGGSAEEHAGQRYVQRLREVVERRQAEGQPLRNGDLLALEMDRMADAGRCAIS